MTQISWDRRLTTKVFIESFSVNVQFLIWVNDSIYVFDSHSKDENHNVSSSGILVLQKSDTLHSLENHIRSV